MPPDMFVGRATGALAAWPPPRLFLNTGEDSAAIWPQRLARLLAAAISLGTVFFVWRAGRPPADAARPGRRADRPPAADVRLPRRPRQQRRADRVLLAGGDVGLVRLCASRSRGGSLVDVGRGRPRLPVEDQRDRPGAAVRARALSPKSAATPTPQLAGSGRGAGALALAGAIVAPWSIRNVVLYGDPFASEAMRHAVAHLITDRSLFSVYFLTDFPRMLLKSFIGVFGWANVLMPTLAYRPTCCSSRSASGRRVAGCGAATRLALAGVLGVSLLARSPLSSASTCSSTQPQGRYLLPGLPAFAVLIALGLRSLPPALACASRRQPSSAAAAGAGTSTRSAGSCWPTYHPAPDPHASPPGEVSAS
jgi:hypothetical protein